MNRQDSKRRLVQLGQSATAAALLFALSCSSSQKKPGTAPEAKAPTGPPSASAAAGRQADKVADLLAKAENELKRKNYKTARDLALQAQQLDARNRKAAKLVDRIASEERRAADMQRRAASEAAQVAAEKKLAAKDFAGALKDAEAAVAADSTNKSARKLVDRIKAEEKEAAAEKASAAGKAQAGAAAAAKGHLADARTALAKDRFDEARKALDKALAADKDSSEAKALAAKIDSREKQFKAEAKARETSERLRQADRLAASGKYADAKAEYEAILRSDSDNRAARTGARRMEEEIAKAAKAAEKPKEVAKAEENKPEPKKAEENKPEPTKAAQEKKPEPAKAAEPTKAAADKDARSAFDELISRGDKAAKEGKYTEALAAYGDAARKFPQFAKDADAKVASARQAQAKEEEAKKAAAARENRRQAQRSFEQGNNLYERKDLEGARKLWAEALDLDPTFAAPKTMLEQTDREYSALLARREAERNFEAREQAAQEKLNTPVSFRTLRPTPLGEFLAQLKVLTGIDFVIAGGVEATVEVAFEERPLKDVLDTALLPIGLKWDRKPGEDVVVVTPDLRTAVFPIAPEQLQNLETLKENGTLGRLLYGPSGQPILKGQEAYSDRRNNIAVITDSPRNIEKFRQLLETLREATPQALLFRSYTVQGNKAPQIKSLLQAILSADDKAPYNPERRLIIDGNTLIIKDTVENLARAEEILKDRNFLKEFYSDRLSVATFNLTPVIEFEDNPDLARQFGEQVRAVVETLLYSQEGRSKAEGEGRRLWYDPASLQLTITDYPDNLDAVSRFIESLPQIQTKRRNKIYFLEWATASELAGTIQDFIGGAQQSATRATGDKVTKNMRVEDELNFNGAFIRVTRVNENDAADQNDDAVELVVRTGTTSQDVTLDEFRSEFVEDFEIVAEDVKPSGTPGEGRVRLTVRLVRQGEGTDTANEPEPTPVAREERTGISIVDIPNLNALYVEYDTAEQLKDIDFWIKTLDIPTLQVSLELRFVEVYETKAREWKPDFIISDLTEGFDFSDSVIGGRFAQQTDEFSSAYEPGTEYGNAANLLQGVTSLNFSFLNNGSPIELRLRALEAAGVINITNSPNATVLNGEEVQFDIVRQLGQRQPVQGATGDENNFTAVAEERPVELTLTPTITQAGNITLEIDVVITDRELNLGQRTQRSSTVGTGNNTVTIPRDAAISNDGGFTFLRKQLETRARIRDGGTVVLGGWISTRDQKLTSEVPLLGRIPFIGRLLFSRESFVDEKVVLNIFLTGNVIRD